MNLHIKCIRNQNQHTLRARSVASANGRRAQPPQTPRCPISKVTFFFAISIVRIQCLSPSIPGALFDLHHMLPEGPAADKPQTAPKRINPQAIPKADKPEANNPPDHPEAHKPEADNP